MLDLGEIWESTKEFFQDNAGTIISGLGKAWVDMNDQERKIAVNEKAYNDYMSQVEAAGKEAEAAVASNLTPMTISNVPTTKADVSDFTAVAARGGLMNLPTRQRKRYASQGFVEDDIEIMEPESLGDFELQKEEGVNIGEQVFHDTGDDRTNAQQVWQSGQVDQNLYQMDFEIFFKSGDWQDHISRGTVQGDTQMASSELRISPQIIAEWEADGGASGPYNTPQEYYEAYYGPTDEYRAQGGIIGLRHGGRPGYQFGIGPQQGMMPQGMMPQGMMPQGMMPQQGLRPGYAEQGFVNPQTSTEPFMTDEEASLGNAEMYEGEIMATPDGELEMIDVMDSVIIMTADGMVSISKEDYDKVMSGEITQEEALANAGYESGIKKIELGNAKGGLPKRVRKAPGGIMDLGGLEKDYRTTGGFVPIGGRERADDVPARLSKNEFVMTADAVRAAGGGSINKGAQRMYDTMKHLEASPQSHRMIS